MFKFLRNLSAASVEDFSLPASPSIARPAFESKDAFRRWCLQPDTNHVFVSAMTGLAETQRVSQTNQPLKMHGYIADFDTRFTGDPLAQIVANTDPEFRPRWISRTFSGGIRAWYVFESPMLFHDDKVGVKFTERVIRNLGVRTLFPGFDLQTTKQYWQYFEAGTDWQEVPDSGTIPLVHLEAWMQDAILVSARNDKRGRITVPFDKVKEALIAKYPGVWPGGWDSFVVGARGTRFWDGGNAQSCLVREDGITCFTGDRGFVSWGELLGREWEQRHTDEVVGAAIEGIYFECTANKYWRKLAGIGWQPLQKEDLKLHFRVSGIADERGRGETLSPVDRLIHQVQVTHSVAGTFPFHYKQADVVYVNSQPFLNTSRAVLAQPDGTASGRWGDGFPKLAAYFEGLYDREHNEEQFAHAMGALMYFYQTAYSGDVQRGRIQMHAGPPGAGKTYQLMIKEKIFGAVEDSSRYLFGQDSFNGTLCHAPLWGVDDPVSAANAKVGMVFSQMLKAVAACDNIPVRGMYREVQRLPWLGRVIVNMNDDPESIRMLPSTEINLMDKVDLYAIQRPFVGKFPSNAEIQAEIPALCTFLLEGRAWLESLVPDLFSDPRWGTKKYHHPRLVAIAQGAQTSTAVEELLRIWRKMWFSVADGDSWTGNPTELLDAISQMDSLRDIYRTVVNSPQALGRALAQLCNREAPPTWLRSLNNSQREYSIYRHEDGAALNADPY